MTLKTAAVGEHLEGGVGKNKPTRKHKEEWVYESAKKGLPQIGPTTSLSVPLPMDESMRWVDESAQEEGSSAISTFLDKENNDNFNHRRQHCTYCFENSETCSHFNIKAALYCNKSSSSSLHSKENPIQTLDRKELHFCSR